jgi:acyl-CoA-binding protein
MAKDKLAELREEWYSEPQADELPETVEEEVDDEILALYALFKSRGVTVAGEDNVKVEGDAGSGNSEEDH